jgi:putative inorganic carbon (hco3(-)) transporter
MVSPITRLSDNKVLTPLLVLASLLLVVLIHVFGLFVLGIVIGLIAFAAVVYVANKFPRYSIVFPLALAFLMPFFIKLFRLYGLPISNAIEGLCLFLFLLLAIKRRLSGLYTIPGIFLGLWIVLQLIEVMNPNASSRAASVIAIRSLIPLLCGFYIVYSTIESKRDVYVYLGAVVFLGLLAGSYGLYQELVGLPVYDLKWATSDERLYNLLFTWGRLRKFSFFFSPADFGMIMCIIGVGSLVMLFFAKTQRSRLFFGFGGFVCIWSMFYSGTRTAMIMLVVGFLMFALITLNRRVLMVCSAGALILAALLIRPTSSRTLFVMLTAFSATEDPSMNVRLKNQNLIRKHIQAHPIGFGLGTTGYLGMKYSPHTFVGSFPPDSELVKIAIETGWVGLFFWCTTLAVLFGYGVSTYFRVKDREWRALLTVMLVTLFMMIVCQYPQEFFRSHVLSMMFAATIAIIAKISTKHKKIVDKETEHEDS